MRHLKIPFRKKRTQQGKPFPALFYELCKIIDFQKGYVCQHVGVYVSSAKLHYGFRLNLVLGTQITGRIGLRLRYVKLVSKFSRIPQKAIFVQN